MHEKIPTASLRSLLLLAFLAKISEGFTVPFLLPREHRSTFPEALRSTGRIDFCYKRLNVSKPDYGIEKMEPVQTAETLEAILNEQGDAATTRSFIAVMDAWMVAFNKGEENQKFEAGERMELMLDKMESNPLVPGTVDVYATVMHLWLSCDQPERALVLLSRMEGNLKDENFSERLRMITYNKVLRGLAKTNMEIAVALLECMEEGSEFRHGDDTKFKASIAPDRKAYGSVICGLLKGGDEDRGLKFMGMASSRGALTGFLSSSIEKVVGQEKLEYLLSQIESDQ